MPVGTARHDCAFIGLCLGWHLGTIALSGTARHAVVPLSVVPSHAMLDRAHVVPCLGGPVGQLYSRTSSRASLSRSSALRTR